MSVMRPFLWLVLVATPPTHRRATPPWLTALGGMMADATASLERGWVWRWQPALSSNPPSLDDNAGRDAGDKRSLLANYQRWQADCGQRPSQESLDWWLAEWHQSWLSQQIPAPLGSDWSTLTSSEVDWLVYGLARLARYERGVIWVAPDSQALAALSRRCGQNPAEQIMVVWAVDGHPSPDEHRVMAESLMAVSPSQPVQVLTILGDGDKADEGLLFGGQPPFRLGGRLRKQDIDSGQALVKVADIMRRLNLPSSWLPPC